MIVKPGEKIHVIIRRQFLDDIRRHFVGEVKESLDNIVKVEGDVFILDPNINLFVKKPNAQTRIISLIDGLNIITILPAATNLKGLSYKLSKNNRMVVTDGESFYMDVNEFGCNR